MSSPLAATSGKRCIMRLLPVLLFLGACQPSAQAFISELITSISFENPTVILDSDEFDGDAATIRHGLHTNIEATVARTSVLDPAVNSRYRVVYSLEDDAGTQLDLANGDAGNTTQITGPVFLVSLPGFPAAPASHVENLVANTDPVLTLDPAKTYRVVSRLEKEVLGVWGIVDDNPTTDTGLITVLHFTNIASGDAEFNIRGVLFGLVWDQKFLVDTDPSNDALIASVAAVMGRYDDFDDPITQEVPNIIFDFDLLDSSFTSIPLVNDGIVNQLLPIDSYDNSGPRKLPAFQFVGALNTEIRPIGQLDPVNETYTLVCTLRHEEDTIPNEFTDMKLTLPDETLLHFNGDLRWGTFLTQFTGLDNIPTPLGGGAASVDTTIVISNGAGVIPENPGNVFGDGVTPLSIELLANGLARLPAAPFQTLAVYPVGNPGGAVDIDLGGIHVTYTGGVDLSENGANAAGITIYFPQGLALIPDRIATPHRGDSSFFGAGPFGLDPGLKPDTDLAFLLGPNTAIFDESHPLVFHTGLFTLQVAGVLDFNTIAVEYIHDGALTTIETLPAAEVEDASMRERFSNDLYLRAATTPGATSHRWTAAPDESARMTGLFEVDPTQFRGHFPQGAKINTGSVSNLIYDKGIPLSAGSELVDVQKVDVSYNVDCPDDPWLGKGEVIVSLEPDDDRLTHTPTGGLWRPGNVLPIQLRWGARGDGANIHPDYPYAHRTEQFVRSSFFMSGYQLYADANATIGHPVYGGVGGDNAPGVLLNAGFNDDPGSPDFHSITETAYNEGDGSYPGLNFIVEAPGDTGASRLGGNTVDFTYELFFNNKNACKYYIRRSGVSGRQVATNGSWTNLLFIYGFEFNFDSFQLSFLDSVPEESWVDGSIKVTGFSNFTQKFTGLLMDCLGELTGADIDPNDLGDKSITYWNSSFNPTSMAFSTRELVPGACPVEFEGALIMGIKTEVAHIPTPLNGIFGFRSNGNLLTPADNFKGIDAAETPITCELAIPPHLTLDGPNQDWTIVSVGDLRFNNPVEANHLAGNNIGFVTWGATINVPYFLDLQVQFITSAPPSNAAPVHLTSGWTEGGKTFFSAIDFDPSHKCWPIGLLSLNDYKLNLAAAWVPVATQSMFGFIDLTYPLVWDDGRRMFQAFAEQTEEFFAVTTQHDVPYMDAKFLKIEFGAQFSGIPEFSIVDVLNSEITKASDAMTEAIGGELKAGFDAAFEEFDAMLSDTMAKAFEPVIEAAAEQVVRPLYGTLQASYNASLGSTRNAWEAGPLLACLKKEIYDAGFISTLNIQLQEIADATGGAASFVERLQDAVEQMLIGIDSIANQVKVVAGQPIFTETLPPVGGDIRPGILYEDAGEYQIVQALVSLLLDKLLEPEVAAVVKPLLADLGSELNAELNALIEELKPAIGQLVSALNQVRGFLIEIHGALDAAGGLVNDINDIVQHAGDMDGILSPLFDIADDLFNDVLDSNSVQPGDRLGSSLNIFDDFSEDEFVAMVKAELQDQLLQNGIVEQIQFVARQKLYDLQAKFSSTIQSTFTQLAEICKEVVSAAVGSLDKTFSDMEGLVGKFAASAEITGYAEFNGDSLRKLRMDLEAKFNLPDEMKIHVYLEVCVITSEDNPAGNGCIEPGEKLIEVRIGAIDVPFDWISDGLRCNLEVKVSLKDTAGVVAPVGISGSIELTGGVIDFQSFKITEFGVALAIGADEAYIAAKARVEFSDYEMAAGIFFGRTCTPDPIRFCDPDVAALIDPGTTFTGVCVYGEVWLPISQIVLGIPPSCLFRISAGVGAGAFVFLEGPTFGGSIFLGVSGEAICLVSIEGSIKMTGVVQSGKFKARGTGKFSACISFFFFDICFNTTVKMTYDDGSWDLDY